MQWHVISGEELRLMLHRAKDGEDVEFLYLELYANADHIDDPLAEVDDAA